MNHAHAHADDSVVVGSAPIHEAPRDSRPPRPGTPTLRPPWYRTITTDQWRVLAAAKAGWMLDAMDFMLYAMAIGELRTYFSINDAMAGLLGTVTLSCRASAGSCSAWSRTVLVERAR